MAPNHHKPFLHLHQSHKIESIYMPIISNLHEIHVEEVMNGWPNGLRIIIIIHSIQVPRKKQKITTGVLKTMSMTDSIIVISVDTCF